MVLGFPGGLLVKDLTLSLLRLGSLQWHGFHPWPRMFCMVQVWPKKKKKKELMRLPTFYYTDVKCSIYIYIYPYTPGYFFGVAVLYLV